MIHSFADTGTADLFHGRNTKRVRALPQDVIERAWRKLDMLNAAGRLEDLQVPPSNNLEALKGDRQGYHSVRINQQWRIVFRWENGAHEVEIVDYH